MVEDVDRLLRIEDVAALTGVPVNTLRYWRSKGGIGPASAKLGPRRVVYREADVRAWIDESFAKASGE